MILLTLGHVLQDSNDGTYLLAGPDWNGQVPQGITNIWSPTNLAWLIQRILVKGPADIPNVLAIQDKIVVKPLSEFQGKAAATPTTTTQPSGQQHHRQMLLLQSKFQSHPNLHS